QMSACSGPIEVRPREGLRPTTPQNEAGMRIEPPASLPCAIGTIREATAAPAPPLEPPTPRSGFHGFRVGPHARVSVAIEGPHSGTVVWPRVINPAARNRFATFEVERAVKWASLSGFHPQLIGSPVTISERSFIRN